MINALMSFYRYILTLDRENYISKNNYLKSVLETMHGLSK